MPSAPELLTSTGVKAHLFSPFNSLSRRQGPPKPLQTRIRRSFDGLKNGLDFQQCSPFSGPSGALWRRTCGPASVAREQSKVHLMDFWGIVLKDARPGNPMKKRDKHFCLLKVHLMDSEPASLFLFWASPKCNSVSLLRRSYFQRTTDVSSSHYF